MFSKVSLCENKIANLMKCYFYPSFIFSKRHWKQDYKTNCF